MRINIYAEELTSETDRIQKTVTMEDGSTETFYGIRFYLKSPDALHHTPTDDDRSAVTLWVPWTKDSGHDFDLLDRLLNGLIHRSHDVRQDHKKAEQLKAITTHQEAGHP